jgi:cobalt-zinc-cadmium efflux system protein
VGVTVNFCAALFTRDGESLNQKAVNLHMLEDVLGWAVVLIGAIVMKFTGFAFIDPLISLGVSAFILLKSAENLKETLFLLLEKTPQGIDINEIKEHIAKLDGIIGVHHVHIWSLDGINNYATMHIVTNADAAIIKQRVREELLEHGICHTTLELETDMELCSETHCKVNLTADKKHCHRH